MQDNRYVHERQRHDLALRMIRHEARTCTIRDCTGLSDDRIRRLYRIYACQIGSAPLRRRRGKSPRQVAFFVRNTRAQFEASMLASAFGAFGLLGAAPGAKQRSLEFGRLFCDAYETHRQLVKTSSLSFEHAWFLLQMLAHNPQLLAVRCRRCDSQYLQDRLSVCRAACPVCKLKRARTRCVKRGEQRMDLGSNALD